MLVAFAILPFAQVSQSYSKAEYDIPMRDGVALHTVVYSPKNVSGLHPILMERTPYSAGPYGEGKFAGFRGSPRMREKGYIFAFQDVRDKYLSLGDYINVRPELKRGEKGIDESTDTSDTVDWLVKNVKDNNGAVGLWGISYPGFYAGVGAINSNPHLKAVSPQAPVSDWFLGDDVHHNGAFFIQDTFNFGLFFNQPRKGPGPNPEGFHLDKGGKSEYDFFLEAGSASDLDSKYLKGAIPYWNETISHANYDAYWKDRSLPTHMRGVKCAVLTVGGWFDAEDMWGALNSYARTERQNRGTPNFLVMGPWYHGMWAGRGQQFGDLDFGQDTSAWYRDNVEFPFFERYLRGQDVPPPAEATVFETGTNRWRTFGQWPPKGLGRTTLYLAQGRGIATTNSEGSDAFVYDPAAPTPYLADYANSRRRTREYMIDDQRWAEKRPDVLTYKGKPFQEDTTFAGPIDVDFWVTTSGTDMDLVVKVIDVYPDDSTEQSPKGASMAGYELNVKADIFRGRFRNSFERPEAFVPGKPTRIHFKMNDLLHTFRRGHRLMVQVQGAWFPLVDRNPNSFVDIYHARPDDYQKATITVLHDSAHPTRLTFGTLPAMLAPLDPAQKMTYRSGTFQGDVAINRMMGRRGLAPISVRK